MPSRRRRLARIPARGRPGRDPERLMTALAGLWNFDGRPDAGASCKRMLAAQRSYGPHDERRWAEGAVAMGRNLFRLVPEDRFDRQPLIGAGGDLVIVADVRL